MKRAFFLQDEKSEKFWSINYEGDNYVVNYGKIGMTGRSDIKEFESEDKCESEALKMISQKVKKGYVEVSDFDFIHRLYFDNEEIGVHRKTSHPNFTKHFTEEFYYECSEEDAPFGSDEGSDALNELQNQIKSNIKSSGIFYANTDISEFPKDLINSWEFSFSPPEYLDEDYLKTALDNPTTQIVEGISAEELFFQVDHVIIATALGQIKITGELQDRLRYYAINSIKRLDTIRKIQKLPPNPYAEKMISDLESFPKPKAPKITEYAESFMDYLDCPCEVFCGLIDDDNMIFAYEQALKEGKEMGYTPLLIIPEETLENQLETICNYYGFEVFSAENMKKCRELIIEKANAINSEECLAELIAELKSNTQQDGEDWIEFAGKYKKGTPLDLYDSHWNKDEHITYETILAKIPTDKPWELAAWIPMGGFNDCPMPEKQVAIMKYWYEQYQVIPAMVTFSTWEFNVQNYDETGGVPIKDKDKAMNLAIEHAAFCQDVTNEETIGELAGGLSKSKVWHFWWD